MDIADETRRPGHQLNFRPDFESRNPLHADRGIEATKLARKRILLVRGADDEGSSAGFGKMEGQLMGICRGFVGSLLGVCWVFVGGFRGIVFPILGPSRRTLAVLRIILNGGVSGRAGAGGLGNPVMVLAILDLDLSDPGRLTGRGGTVTIARTLLDPIDPPGDLPR